MATDYARQAVLDMVYKAQSSHIGSNFSVIEILKVLFERKGKIILSAGWKASAFYYFLAINGFFPEEELDTYNQEGSRLIGLTEPGVPGVYFAGGSMGLGFPAAVGFALSEKMKGSDTKIYCVMSDGEMGCGTTWESAMIASHHKLSNLTVIIDDNGLQAMGKTSEILDNASLKSKWRAFGFCTTTVNGHDTEELNWALNHPDHNKPMCIVAKTIKGKGVSFMENDNRYHYFNLSKEDYENAKQELNG